MAVGAHKTRLGRRLGLADRRAAARPAIGAEVEGQRIVPLAALKAGPVQPAAELLRRAARGACRLDPRARAGAAARGAPVRPRTTRPTRSSPASAAGGPRSSPICTRCRSSSARCRDQEAIEIAIIENVQREDLNAIEEAEGYKLLMDGHGYTQEDLAKVIGKSRSHLANTLRLLKLPDSVQDLVRTGELSAGHARALIGRADAAALAARIVNEGLTVRQVEALVQDRAPPSRRRQAGARTPTRARPRPSSARRSGLTSRSSDRAGARRASCASATRASTSSRICATGCCASLGARRREKLLGAEQRFERDAGRRIEVGGALARGRGSTAPARPWRRPR